MPKTKMVISGPAGQQLGPGYILKMKLIDVLMEIGYEVLEQRRTV